MKTHNQDAAESLSESVTHLLEECRMVLPGIQALFGFQLIAVFNSTFWTKLDRVEQLIHYAALGLIASVWALYVHYRLQSDPTYVSVCEVNESVSCQQVLTSQYGSVLGVPVAAGGAIWSLLAFLLAAFGLKDPKSETASRVSGYLFVLATLGLASVFYFIGLPVLSGVLPAGLAEPLRQLSVNFHFENIGRGVIDSRDLEAFLPELIYHQDEPLADWVAVPLHYVSKLARDNGTVVVQIGEGSDELFHGYQNYRSFARFHSRYRPAFRFFPSRIARQSMSSRPRGHESSRTRD